MINKVNASDETPRPAVSIGSRRKVPIARRRRRIETAGRGAALRARSNAKRMVNGAPFQMQIQEAVGRPIPTSRARAISEGRIRRPPAASGCERRSPPPPPISKSKTENGGGPRCRPAPATRIGRAPFGARTPTDQEPGDAGLRQQAHRAAQCDKMSTNFADGSAIVLGEAIDPLNEAPHPILPQIARESYRGNQSRRCVFTQAGSVGEIAGIRAATVLVEDASVVGLRRYMSHGPFLEGWLHFGARQSDPLDQHWVARH